jgi:hypothetical protein
MGLNAIGEFGQRDEDVSRITRKAARLLRQTLIRVLTTAKKQKELRSDADLDSMADFFEGTLAGIRMAAKAGKSRRALRNIAAFAGRAYMGLDCARGTAARLRSNENTETVRDKARILGRGNGKKKLLGVLLPGGTRNEADTSATGDVQ